MKNITLQSNKNLEAKFWFPKETKKGIIIAPSFRNTFKQPVCFEAAEEFYNKGYAVLAFNFLGHGNSEGSLKDVSYKTISENVSSAIKYLKNKGIEKIGSYAISLGTIATVLSREQPDAQFLISPSPLYNPKGLLNRYFKYIDSQQKELEKKGYAIVTSGSGRGDFKMGKKWIDEMKGDIKIIEIYLDKKIPTLIIQGTEDEPGRLNQVKNFIDSTKSNFLFIKGADHEITTPEHRKIVINKAVKFFEETL